MRCYLRFSLSAVLLPILVVAGGAALAEATDRGAFPGPVAATVTRVVDGDTFSARAHVWPSHDVTVNVRIRGIDAPERKARCDGERAAAIRAREALEALVAGQTVSLTNIGGAKYYGRVLADVSMPDGDVASALLAAALVRPYKGGRRESWCTVVRSRPVPAHR